MAIKWLVSEELSMYPANLMDMDMKNGAQLYDEWSITKTEVIHYCGKKHTCVSYRRRTDRQERYRSENSPATIIL